MGRVLTNNTALSFTVETSLGTAGTTWTSLEPNDIGTFGATTTTVAREPISKDRARRKGTITDLESSVEFESDMTVSAVSDFAEGFTMAVSPLAALRWDNVSYAAGAGDFGDLTAFTATTAALMTYAGGGAASLVYASGFGSDSGVYKLNLAPANTDTDLSVASGPSTSYAAAPGQRLEVCGVSSGTADITISVTAGVATVTSAADIASWSALGLTVGQTVFVGRVAGGGASYGYGRITALSSGTMTLDKIDATLVAVAGQQADVMFGQFYRNVSTDNAAFLERSYQFELTMPNLGLAAATAYEYAKGNFANTLSLNVPLADKATLSFGFVGTDTEVPTTTQKTHSADVEPTLTEAFNTSADVLRLRVTDTDENAMTSCFKDFTLTLNNNVSPERCIGTLGAEFMNTGNFLVDLEAEVLFTDADVVSAIRNNETVTLDAVIRNSDGAVAVDIPSLTLGDGAKSFPVNESVTISLSGQAFNDQTIGTSVGISTLPGVPAS
jgi:hypothetical protein